MTKIARLLGASQKLQRAKTKFANLETLVDEYISSRPHTLRLLRRDNATFFISKLNSDLPEDFCWELVETIGHLRSALDKIVLEMAEYNGSGTSNVGFPFVSLTEDGPNPFETKRIKDVLKKLTPQQADLVKACKPFPSGNAIFWAINSLANIDKHQKGLVEIQPAIEHGIAFNNGLYTDVWMNPSDRQYVLDDPQKEKVLLVISGAGYNQQLRIIPKSRVVFGDFLPVAGQSVIEVLREQLSLVDSFFNSAKITFQNEP